MNRSELIQLAQPLQAQLSAWRRDLHRHPEIGYEEHRTSAIVAEHLESLGLEVTRNVGQTGLQACFAERPMDQPLLCARTWMPYQSRIRKRWNTARKWKAKRICVDMTLIPPS